MVELNQLSWNKLGLSALALLMLSNTAHGGEDIENAQKRILELERQMQHMAEQLKMVQDQLVRSKDDATPATAKVTTASNRPSGSPVEASFNNGLVLRDATDEWSLRLYARTQLDYRHFSPDDFSADTFSIRRARLGTIATFLDDFSMRIEAEYSDTTAKLNDAWLDYTHFKGAMLRVGQFYTMHGLERSQGAMDINFMERALSDSLLGSVYERGVMLHGSPLKGLHYNLTYMNGSGQNADESSSHVKSDSKDWSLRATGNLAQWAGWQNSVIHVGGTYVNGKQAADSPVPILRTEGRGVKFFSTTNGDKFTTKVDRTLTAFETALAHGPAKLQSEYIHANFDGVGFDRDMSAWYASLQWMVTGEQYASVYKNGAFGAIAPTNNFRYGNGGWGALELGMRYTRFDASDFNAVLGNQAQYTDGADAWTLGAKWMPNTHAQLQLNYVRTAFDSPITLNGKKNNNEDAINIRMQYDF